MTDCNNDNITFFLGEKEDKTNTEEDIKKMMEDFNSLTEDENQFGLLDNYDMEYFLQKSNFGNDELFYEQEYTIKELIKICSYYGLDKDIRTSKCKKQDIISTIIYFESLPENVEIVQKRNRMWAYISELLHDTKMKKYIIWN